MSNSSNKVVPVSTEGSLSVLVVNVDTSSECFRIISNSVDVCVGFFFYNGMFIEFLGYLYGDD